ncbi:MAG: tRNA (adenosine(37)-N6)-threonylcarbamoyltransferase complex transferase subunit TsaD [Mycoplasmoidaceae bacterium]
MKIIAIETTCDDTAISIMEDNLIILNEKISSEKFFSDYGGIVPEIAARKHAENIIIIIKNLLNKNKIKLIDVNYVAYASEPGLVGSLHVGEILSRTISWYYNIPLIKINHIIAHCFSAFINNCDVSYPFISLIASGGTTSLFLIKNINDITTICQKKDDALGEAFDKIGRLLGLKYPGGPEIDKIFDPLKVKKIFKKQNVLEDFSFSGVKSKIVSLINFYKKQSQEIPVIELASSFQSWAIDLLIEKIQYYQKIYNVKLITIGGGVSSNSLWKKRIKEIEIPILYPQKDLCCDNAAMIAFLASEKIKNEE